MPHLDGKGLYYISILIKVNLQHHYVWVVLSHLAQLHNTKLARQFQGMPA